MIQSPHTIAKLPQGPLPDQTIIQSADVLSVVGSKKRKRSEVAVAVDGSSTNLYNVRSTKLITSYNVSPQTAFTCPPCSIRLQRASSDNRQRLTFVSTTSNKAKLQLFRQNVDQQDESVSSHLDVRPSAKPIIHLDIVSGFVQADNAACIELLAVHEDGEISCYTESLDKRIWNAKPLASGGTNSSAHVEYASVISINEAQKALLKGREDILASFGDTGDIDFIKLLMLLTTSDEGNTLTFRLFRTNLSTTNLVSSGSRGQCPLREILTVPIPKPSVVEAPNSRYSLHVPSGTLYQSTANNIVSYDMSGCIPSAGQIAQVDDGESVSLLRISPSLLATASGRTISILNPRYNASQDQLILPKNKNSRSSGSDKVVLLSYNTSLDILVVLHNQELKAIQLSTSTIQSDGSRKRKNEGLLIDSLGRSAATAKRRLISAQPREGSEAAGVPSDSQLDDHGWEKQKHLVDEYIADSDMLGLERLLSQESDVVDQNKDHHGRKGNVTRLKYNQQKVEYIISRIFEVSTNQTTAPVKPKANGASKRLTVAKHVKSIPPWLFSEGCLLDHQVEIALKHEGLIASSDHIETGSLAEALARWDLSLQMLSAFLDGAAFLTATDVVHILRHIITGEESSEAPSGTKLLTNGEAQTVEGLEIAVAQNPVSKIDEASPTTQSGGNLFAESILTTASKKILAYPSYDVSVALKNVLSKHQMRLLVDMLRIRLARNGWLTPYVGEGFQPTAEGRPEDNQICVVAHLLSCLVDSIGTGGWLMGNSIMDDFTETAETIAYMKAEISAALEGIEEASYIKGVLGEMLLYGKRKYPKASKQRISKDANEQMRPAIVLIDDVEDSTLPLGLKPPQDISAHKVGAGGELFQRSARDIGRLKNRMVPKYSLERITV